MWEPILDNSGILVINSTIKYAVPIIHILNEKTKKKTNIEKFTANWLKLTYRHWAHSSDNFLIYEWTSIQRNKTTNDTNTIQGKWDGLWQALETFGINTVLQWTNVVCDVLFEWCNDEILRKYSILI